MKLPCLAATLIWFAAFAGAQAAEGTNAPPNASPRTASRKETHPILLIRPDQVDRYKVRVADMPEGMKTYGMSTDIPLVALIDYLRGRRCEEAVASVKAALASKDTARILTQSSFTMSSILS